MGTFLDPLHLDYLDGRQWLITAPFTYQLADGSGEIRVPADMVTDFASIPRILWTILAPTGSYGKAAVLHDYLYRHRLVNVPDRLVDREEADAIFAEAMRALGVNWATRAFLYRGVRVTSGAAWDRYRSAERAADTDPHHDRLDGP